MNVSHSISNGGAGDDIITNSGANVVFDYAKNDGNDTLTGSDDADIFVYNSGNDVITDYGEQDKIKLSDVTLSDLAISKKDFVLKVGRQNLTVKNAKDKEITLSDGRIISDGNIFDAKKVSATLTSTNNFDLSKYNAVKNADASSRTTSVKITGARLAARSLKRPSAGKNSLLQSLAAEMLSSRM